VWNHVFDTQIDEVTETLLRDGHYTQAVLQAYICVINRVKKISNLEADGEPLMNRAFGCENHKPIIRFNRLESKAERDQQQGMMFLFKGVVGIRNSLAHSIRRLILTNQKALDYVAIASALMRSLPDDIE
jgi:uncharacterized protein (TIGR02391 family)